MASGDMSDEHLSMCFAFCSTTELQDSDIGLAQFYLEEASWNVQAALQNYRQAQSSAKEIEQPASSAVSQTSGALSSGQATAIATSSTSSTESKKKTIDTAANQPSQKKFRLITWNIDGLDSQQHTLQERTTAVCDAVKLYVPDVVYLQEVVPLSCAVISSSLQDYKLIPGGEREYFTAVLIKKSSVDHVCDEIDKFPGSVMLRNLQIIQVKLAGINLTLMCSHLESTKNFVTERVNQLKTVFQRMKGIPASNAVIFGGDLNLRDPEVSKAGGLPTDVADIWQLCGSPSDAKFTWDTSVNDNLGLSFAAKCRFDRLYLRQGASSGLKVTPERFLLIGKKRLPGCRRFPSDHWGILCDFKLEDEE